ncbi:MAG: hypothetical protein V1787_04455 [Candidatus Micrarchaeota archaeon]
MDQQTSEFPKQAPALQPQEDEEELEEPEEGDYAGLAKYQALRLWFRVRGPLKRYWLPLLVLVAIVGLGYWYYFARPQPGSIVLRVMQVDEDKGVLATVSLAYEDGNPVGGELLTDPNGLVVLNGVPAGRDLQLQVTPLSSKLKPALKFVSALDSRESRKAEVQVGRKTGLKFISSGYSAVVASKCSRSLLVEVENTGVSDEALAITAEGQVADLVRPTQSDVIEPETQVLVPVRITAKSGGGDVSGSLRIRGTTVSVPLEVTVKETRPRLDVSFDQPDAKDFTAPPGTVKKSYVIIRNGGGADSAPITDVNVSVKGDFANWASVTETDQIADANAGDGIPAERTASFLFTVSVPMDALPGQYVGKLEVASSCDTHNILLNAVIQ